MTKNENINLEALEILFEEPTEEDMRFQDLFFQKQIRDNYKMFLDHINEFGLGMIVFPSMVKQLDGDYFISMNSIDPVNPNTITNMN